MKYKKKTPPRPPPQNLNLESSTLSLPHKTPNAENEPLELKPEATSLNPNHHPLNINHQTNPQPKSNYCTDMCSGSEEGSYLRRIDFCMT